MVNHSETKHSRQRKRAHKTKGVEEREDTEKSVILSKRKHVAELFDVRTDVVVSQHHSLGIAGAAARENDRGDIVEGDLPIAPEELFKPRDGANPGKEERAQFFCEARLLSDIFQEDSLAWQFDLHLVQKGFRGDDGLDAALADAGGNRFFGHGVVEIDRHFAGE